MVKELTNENISLGYGKTDNEILKNWDKTYFLTGLSGEVKLKTALIMEDMFKILKKKNKFKNIDIVAFAAGRRIVTKLYDRKFKSDEQKEKSINLLTSKFILNELNKLINISTNLYNEIYKGHEKLVDIEAEMLAFICDRIEHLHYLKNY